LSLTYPFGNSVDHDVSKNLNLFKGFFWLGENVSLELLPLTTFRTS